MEWDSIQVNQDCVCDKHKDKHNTGDSYLVSFGSYTGGELVVEEEVFDTNKKPIVFNGAEREHWNNPLDENSQKWTIVLFRTSIPKKFEKEFPEDWRTCPDYVAMKS